MAVHLATIEVDGLLNFVHNSTAANNANPILFQTGGGMCAQGTSAGSAAIVYTLSWFGAGYGSTGFVDNVELISGPVLSRVDNGCQVPISPSLTVCQGSPGCRLATGVQPWTVTETFADGFEKGPREWSNIYACANVAGNNNTNPWNGVWNNMSILSSSIGSQQLSYPSTSMNSWLCGSVYNGAEPMNNSSSEGWLFYQQASWDPLLPAVVNAVTSCDGPEGVAGTHGTGPNGIAGGGSAMIISDMETQCKAHTH